MSEEQEAERQGWSRKRVEDFWADRLHTQVLYYCDGHTLRARYLNNEVALRAIDSIAKTQGWIGVILTPNLSVALEGASLVKERKEAST